MILNFKVPNTFRGNLYMLYINFCSIPSIATLAVTCFVFGLSITKNIKSMQVIKAKKIS